MDEPSRFGARRSLAAGEAKTLAAIEAKAGELEALLRQAAETAGDEPGEYFAEAERALELAVMWAARGLSAGQPAKPAPRIVVAFEAVSGEKRYRVHDADDKPVPSGLLTLEQAEQLAAQLAAEV